MRCRRNAPNVTFLRPVELFAKDSSMERLVDYLERAIIFDRLAVEEANPNLKANFERKAGGYRKMATGRAHALGVELSEIQTGTLNPRRPGIAPPRL
jgi:hypothetical protein